MDRKQMVRYKTT